MSPKPISIAGNIARALNSAYGTHVVINTSQFYDNANQLVRVYYVKDARRTPKSMYMKEYELFRSSSGVYVCLFMRDLMYAFQGKERPKEDNAGYNEAFAKRDGEGSIRHMLKTYKEVEL